MIRYEKALRKRLEGQGQRQLILYGGDYFTEYIQNELEKMKILVKERVWGEIDKSDLGGAYTKDNTFILVAVCSGHKAIYEKIVELGFVYNQDFALMNIGGYCRPINAIDPLLSFCRDDSEVPQYYKIGEGEMRIAIYGSSTSDEEKAGEVSWPRVLHGILQEQGIDATVYNGAVSGYNSAQELIKVIRDILVIKPHLVISFSGVNDIGFGTSVKGYPLVHKYQKRMWENILGIQGAIPDSMDMRNMDKLSMGMMIDEKQDYEIWLYHEKVMKMVCESQGINFIGVLEPMISAAGYMIEEDLNKLLLNCGIDEELFEKQRCFCRNVRKRLKQETYIYDMSECFSGMSEKYIDYMHCNLSGNTIIAQMIAKKILVAWPG